MNLKLEEQLLIKDIFDATVNPDEHSRTYLAEFAAAVSSLGENVSLVTHSSYFDSMLIEKLKVPGTDILECLQDSWDRAEAAIGKAWNNNQENQSFIRYSIEIIKNFISLSLENPQLFPDQLIVDANASQSSNRIVEIAMKVLTHIQRRGYSEQLLKVVGDGIGPQFYD